MRGRPRKIFLDRDAPVQITGRVKKWIRDLIPHDANISHDFESYILVKYGDADRAQLEALRMKEIELREELSSVRGRILVIEEKIRAESELKKAIETQQKLLEKATRKLVMEGIARHGITMRPEFISKIYGVSLDIDRLNRDVVDEDWKLDYETGKFSDIELAERYSVVKTGKGQRENEFLNEITRGAEP